jgi:cell wall-associated NlpC family hydrolase
MVSEMKLLPALALAVAVPSAALVALIASGSAASASNASTIHNPVGHIDGIYRSARAFDVRGWAADPDVKGHAVTIQYTLDGHVVSRFVTGIPRPIVAHDHHVGPDTGFQKQIAVTPVTHTLCVLAGNLRAGAPTSLGCFKMNAAGQIVKPAPDRNAQISALAAKFVGYRYVENGATPAQGFDCSGLVQYVYRNSIGLSLPHNAQAQYNGARPISAAQARPGDLVFFHSGGGVYHVGIYASPNRMWAAATPADGVRYQTIWSSAVTYGTYTH